MPIASAPAERTSGRHTERLKVELDTELLSRYEVLALLAGCEVEDYIARHLARTRDWTDSNPIYLGDVEAGAVRRMLGGQIGARKSLVEAIKRIVLWRVGGWSIELPESVQEQIYWYARSAGRPVDEVAPQLVLDAIRAKFQS